jgi:RHS repeat-associated protein
VDWLGSTRTLTDATGAVVSRHDYAPMGKEIPTELGGRESGNFHGAAGPRVKFTGKERDAESGLDYFGARYYSGAQGRFGSPDPYNVAGAQTPEELDAFVSNPQGWNRYAYTLNDPLNYVDPDGMKEISAADCTRDTGCVTVKLRFVYDNSVSAAGLAGFQSTMLANARNTFGTAKIRFDVTTEAGSSKTALQTNAVNILLTGDSAVFRGAGISDVVNGTAFAKVNLNNADSGTLAHELGHIFSFETTLFDNPTLRSVNEGLLGAPGLFFNTFADLRNELDLAFLGMHPMGRFTYIEGMPRSAYQSGHRFNRGAARFGAR